MEIPNLHIVIYSELLEYGGGRETWLEYFLQGLINNERFFGEIWVHHLHSRSQADSLAIKIKNINFNELDLGFPEKNNTLINMIKFTRFIVRSLKQNAENRDIVLFVGTGMEAVATLIMGLLCKKNITMLVWVRSIIAGELMSRKSTIASRFAQKLEKRAFSIADGIIFNGKDTKQYYEKMYADMSNKFTTIENAVKYDEFAVLDFPDFGNNYYNIGYIGRFSREKGFDNLIEAAELLEKQEKPNNTVKIHAWGHGINFDNVPSNIKISNYITRNNVPMVLEFCHGVLFLNKSAKHEAGGLSHGLLEAMAAGRLIIAWDNVIHRQVLDESNAILVPEGKIEQLAYTLTEIINMDKEKLISKCENARATAKQFTVKKHIEKFIQFIRNIVIREN
jgi:glycosyltransferase involved in cell wall biosynthesis